MKKKIDEYGNPYIFSTDKGIEMTCISIINCLKDIETKPTSDIAKYHLAAEYYLENAPDDAMIFKRKPDLSNGDDASDVMTWIKLCVKKIVDTIGIKETHLNVTLKEGRENKNGVGYKIGSDGCIYSHNILLPYRYLKTSTEDFERILDDNDLSFDELTCQRHYRIISDIRTWMFKAKKTYPSIEYVREENPYNNSKTEETEFKFTRPVVSKKIKRMSNTIDVFHIID